MFEIDYSDEQIRFKQELLTQCMTNDPNYSKYEQDFKDYQLNWSFNNSDIMYFTDLSVEKENQLVDKYGNRLSVFDLPNGHFISIFPNTSLSSFEEPKLMIKDDRIFEKRFIKLKNNNFLKAYLFDTRYLSPNSYGGFYLHLEVPYNTKSNNEHLQQFESINISANIFYNDEKEKDFFQLIDTFQLTNN
jgi:hypothetical protein